MVQQDFINRIAPLAMENMHLTDIPASLTIAQAILESNWGRSELTVRANNLFGIKGVGPRGSVTMESREFVQGRWVTVTTAFRAYHSWEESIRDHSDLLLNGTRSNPTRYHGVIGADYRTASYEVWRGGYATDPAYPEKLIQLIEQYGLWKFDEQVKEERRMLEDLKKQVERLLEENERLKRRLDALEARPEQTISPWAEAGYRFVTKDRNGETISDGTRPKDPMTREEAWTMLERFHRLIR